MQNPNKTPTAAEATMVGEGCPNRSPEEYRAQAVADIQPPIPTPVTSEKMQRERPGTNLALEMVLKTKTLGEKDAVRTFIEKQPYTGTLLAFGLGLVIGYAVHDRRV